MDIRKIKPWFINTVALATVFGAGLGLGSTVVFVSISNDKPAFVIQEKWRTVTTAPPVTYIPETPFHIDDDVICTTTTIKSSTTTTGKKPS